MTNADLEAEVLEIVEDTFGPDWKQHPEGPQLARRLSMRIGAWGERVRAETAEKAALMLEDYIHENGADKPERVATDIRNLSRTMHREVTPE